MRRLVQLLVVSLFAATLAAQSADQEIVSAIDSPDPVIPGSSLTYTVTVRNNGPDAAVNGGLNILLDGNFTPTSVTPPAGFNCTPLAQIMTCSTPSFTAGTTAVFTIAGTVAPHLANFADGTLTSQFSTSGVTPDPNNGNNSSGNVVTAYDSPQIDLSVAVTDSPDPVQPDNNITYTVVVENAGPNTATNVNFNSFNNGSLRYQSIVIPTGWSCPSQPAVNGVPTFTCTNPSFASGASSTFTIVVRADSAVLGLNDGTVTTTFSANGTGNETNNGNNLENEDTAYQTLDADMGVAVTDSPDPVFPDGNITYTITVTNSGPDATTNAQLSIFNNGSLRFQSITEPVGWNCTEPAVNATPTFNCSTPNFPVGGNVQFTLVVRADDEVLGINDGTVSTSFGVSSALADPDGNDNVENEDTAYVTPDANLSITASDNPDPVVNGANLTFTVNAANGGPDAGPATHVVMSPHPSLVFQSVTAPAGWTCTTPAVDAAGVIDCQLASFPNGGAASFTLVTKLVTSGSGGTLTSNFSTHSSVQDPNNTNNSVQVFTNWIGQTSDLALTKTTLTTAAAQGDTITYTLATSNNGPDAASNVTVTDVLPASLLFQSITAPAGWSCTTPAVGANGTVSCTIATFANGATANFTLVTTVAPNATGTVDNTASIGFTGGTDPNPGNSSGVSGGSIPISGPATSADLSVTKTSTATSAPQGSMIPYTITITNNGPDTATGVGFSDPLPAELLFQSLTVPAGFTCTTPAVGANGTITCNGGTLANGASAVFNLVVQMNASSGSVVNGVTVESDASDQNSGNSSTSSVAVPGLPASADVSISKTTTTTSYVTGATINYTITVTNAGPSPATNVVVTDTLAAGLELLSVTPSQGSCSGTTTITCNLGTLADDAVATIALSVRANTVGSPVNNTASVTATEDTTGGNNSSSAPPVAFLSAADAPTLSEWALIALALGLTVLALRRIV